MDHAPLELKEEFTGVPVTLVLPDGIVVGLFGESVLELERDNRQAIDEEAEVEGQPGLVLAVLELPGYREDIFQPEFLGPCVSRRGSTIEQGDRCRAMLDTFPQHIDDPAFGNLALEPGKELIPLRTFIADAELFHNFRLGILKECKELYKIDRVIPVIVFWAPLNIGEAAIDRWFIMDRWR